MTISTGNLSSSAASLVGSINNENASPKGTSAIQLVDSLESKLRESVLNGSNYSSRSAADDAITELSSHIEKNNLDENTAKEFLSKLAGCMETAAPLPNDGHFSVPQKLLRLMQQGIQKNPSAVDHNLASELANATTKMPRGTEEMRIAIVSLALSAAQSLPVNSREVKHLSDEEAIERTATVGRMTDLLKSMNTTDNMTLHFVSLKTATLIYNAILNRNTHIPHSSDGQSLKEGIAEYENTLNAVITQHGPKWEEIYKLAQLKTSSAATGLRRTVRVGASIPAGILATLGAIGGFTVPGTLGGLTGLFYGLPKAAKEKIQEGWVDDDTKKLAHLTYAAFPLGAASWGRKGWDLINPKSAGFKAYQHFYPDQYKKYAWNSYPALRNAGLLLNDLAQQNKKMS